VLTKTEAGEAVQAAKARLGVTWAQLAETVGRGLLSCGLAAGPVFVALQVAPLSTDSYAIITAVLAGVFAGLVVLGTDVHPFKTPVAVAASTLAAAALFNPLHRRVQRAVDRRLNRAHYNAEAIVSAFTARLRGTVDLDTMQGDLVGAVHQAFEPAHVSVWVATTGQREAPSPRALPGHVSA
jgi:hypothetical protein